MSKIEWTTKTWNPTTGCNKVSPGCKFCYAETMHKRLQGMKQTKYRRNFLDGAEQHEGALFDPFKWLKATTIFVDSMSDLFHEDIQDNFILRVFGVMAVTPHHTYQILTKRPERMNKLLNLPTFRTTLSEYTLKIGAGSRSTLVAFDPLTDKGWPLRNVWLGTSVENQEYANLRVPHLLQTPAAIRFLSCEPLLGAVDLTKIVLEEKTSGPNISFNSLKGWNGGYNQPDRTKLDWIIAGGESGNKKNVRPAHPDWFLSLRDQCAKNGTAYFFKQWGSWKEGTNGKFLTEHPGKHCFVCIDGQVIKEGNIPHGKSAVMMSRVGKKISGSLLDGKEYKQFPHAKA